MTAPDPAHTTRDPARPADYVRDAFDEVDEALHLGRLLKAVLDTHGCGCAQCTNAWDALNEYPEFADGGSTVADTVCHAEIDRLVTEARYLREALVLARQVIDPEQHDVIEEIDMALAYRECAP